MPSVATLPRHIITLCKIAAFGAGDADARGAALYRAGDSKTVRLPAVAKPLTVCGITRLSADNNHSSSHTFPRPPTPEWRFTTANNKPMP